MITRRTLKRTVAGLLLLTLGMLATGCDEAEYVAKAGTAGKILLPSSSVFNVLDIAIITNSSNVNPLDIDLRLEQDRNLW